MDNDNTVRKALGRQFRMLRDISGIGLRPFAVAMGCSLYIIRRHEAGTVSLRADDIIKAARIMGVRPAELLYIGKEATGD